MRSADKSCKMVAFMWLTYLKKHGKFGDLAWKNKVIQYFLATCKFSTKASIQNRVFFASFSSSPTDKIISLPPSWCSAEQYGSSFCLKKSYCKYLFASLTSVSKQSASCKVLEICEFVHCLLTRKRRIQWIHW